MRRIHHCAILLSIIACASSSCGGDSASGGPTCALAPTLAWSGSAPVISPRSDATHDLVAVKDPTVVQVDGRWHVFASSVSRQGAYNMVYTTFTDWAEAPNAPLTYMDQTPGFNTYVAAPQLFYFRPQKKWYLVFQSGPPMYSRRGGRRRSRSSARSLRSSPRTAVAGWTTG
jgi:hypothetical protein